MGSKHELDLEAVALGGEGLADELLEERTPVHPIPASGVVDRESEHDPRVRVPRS